MSWYVQAIGTKAGVKRRATELFDQHASAHEGKAEAADILACKARALALVDAHDLDPDLEYAPEGYVIMLEASGAHASAYGGKTGLQSANFKLEVKRFVLAMDMKLPTAPK